MRSPGTYNLPNAWTAHPRAAQLEFPANDPAHPEIWAYTDRMSYSHGERVALFVHCTGARFDLVVFRDGPTREVVHCASGLAAVRQKTPRDAYERGCGWSIAHEFSVGREWRSGVYVIELATETGNGRRAEGEHFIVVRPGRPSEQLALVLATSTYTAYNDWGGANSYRSVVDGVATDRLAPRLSLARPWARGFVKHPAAAPRHSTAPVVAPGARPTYPWLGWALEHGYSRHYCDAGWAHYERPFAHWAEASGFALDYYTQHDLHFELERFAGYRGVISVGHDEYWSWEMRDAIDSVRRRGAHYARFGGNLIWQIRLEDEGRTQVCYKIPADDPCVAGEHRRRVTTHWDVGTIDRTAAATFGLTGMAGVYNRFGVAASRASGGLTVYRPDHWAFAGTDLYYGDLFGAGPAQIACFEVDGADYTVRGGLPYVTGIDGAPPDLQVLALTPAARGEDWRHGGPLNAPMSEVLGLMQVAPTSYEFAPYGVGMMAVHERDGSILFNAGMAEWVGGLIAKDVAVEAVTRNVLRRMRESQS